MLELGYDDILIAFIGIAGIAVISYWLEKIYRKIRHISHILDRAERNGKGE